MAEKKIKFPNQFLGPSYSGRVKRANAERTVNMYLELNPIKTGANQEPGVLIGMPGLDVLHQIDGGPIRGLYTDASGDTVYAVSGSSAYRFRNNSNIPNDFLGNVDYIGSLRTATGPVSICDNGTQVVFVDGQYGYFCGDDATVFPYVVTNTLQGGTNYVNGTYTNFPITGGSGTGLTANLVVSGNSVTNFSIYTSGTGYQVGDVLGLSYLGIGNITGGTGYTDGAYENVQMLGGSGTTAFASITIQNGSVISAVITSIGINFIVGDQLTFAASSVGGTGSGFIGLVTALASPTIGTNGIIETLQNTIGGSGYVDGYYQSVPLTGGTGSGATANFTVLGSAVNGLQIQVPGQDYLSGDILSVDATNLGLTGAILSYSNLTAGSGYVSGTYPNVPLINGYGTMATANLVVTSGSVSSFLIVSEGQNFHVNDVISVNNSSLGGTGSGFSFIVTSVGNNTGSGFTVQVDTIIQSTGFSVNVANAPLSLTQITSNNFYPSSSVAFQDGFFIFNQIGTANFFLSNLYSVTLYPLNEANKSGSVDPINTVINLNRVLYLLGTSTIETWWDSGQSGTTPFARQDGQYNQVGCLAPASCVRLFNSFIWLGQSPEGGCVVYQMQDSQAIRISNHPVETYLQKLNFTQDLSQSVAYTWQTEGHYFYVLNCPGADTTWIWDLSTGEWSEQQSINNGVVGRHRGQNHCYIYGRHLIGDFENGNVYVYDYDTYTDNGQPIPRMRQAPHIVDNLNNIFYKLFQIDFTPGTGTVYSQYYNAMNPQVILETSDDGGETWGNPMYASIGKAGKYTTRARWQRLGYSRDRIFRVSCSDPVKFDIVSAILDMEEGNA